MAKKKDVIDRLSDASDLSMTFNPLLNALRENDTKNLFTSNVTTVFHKTGYHLFDYYFGSIVNIHNELGEIIKQEPRLGQAAGVMNLIIGASSSGKTTLAVQLASNIIRQYEHGNIIHFDCEQRFDISRGENISQLPISYFQSGRYIIRSGAVALDSMQKSIMELYAAKMKMKDELLIPTGMKDEFNNEVSVLPPSIIIIDSITSVINETFSYDNSKELSDASKLKGNTEGARDAKTLKGFFKDVLPLCKEANIIIYAINHINTNMSMNSFIPVARQQNYLKQEESIPGGKTMLYYPYNIIKLTAKPSDDFTEESDGVSGHIVMVEPVKSSSNQSGNNSKGISFEMLFSFKHGFDPLRSLLLYGKNKGIIDGTKSRMRFKEDPSFTFSLKNIMQEKDEKPIWENAKKYILPELETHLSFIEPGNIKFDQRLLDY